MAATVFVQEAAEDRASAKHREACSLRTMLEKALDELGQRMTDTDLKDKSVELQLSKLQEDNAA